MSLIISFKTETQGPIHLGRQSSWLSEVGNDVGLFPVWYGPWIPGSMLVQAISFKSSDSLFWKTYSHMSASVNGAPLKTFYQLSKLSIREIRLTEPIRAIFQSFFIRKLGRVVDYTRYSVTH